MNGRCLSWFMWLGNRTCCIVAIPVVEQVVKHAALYSTSHRFPNSYVFELHMKLHTLQA
jgi:hypothetical protein